MDEESGVEPAGFWRRAIACFIDLVICALVLGVVAAMMFAATGGRVQMKTSFVPERCWNVDPLPTQLTLPPGFKPNQAKFCQQDLLGWPMVRALTLTERTVEGNFTNDINMQLVVDANNMTWAGNAFDAPIEILLVLLRLVSDALARSPGRRFCGIAVVDRATGGRAPFSRLWRRYLLFSIPVGLAYLSEMLGFSIGSSFEPFGLAGEFWLVVAVLLINLALTIWIVNAIVRRRPTFYDGPVGTSVERR